MDVDKKLKLNIKRLYNRVLKKNPPKRLEYDLLSMVKHLYIALVKWKRKAIMLQMKVKK